MIRYIHFAFSNLYLINGFREFTTSEGVEREYEEPDRLEQRIRVLVLRKNEPLRGWDLRFLRRGLELSQADLGLFLDRDAQTIARWEKSDGPIPKFVDLTIRARFADRYEPQMTIHELIKHIDGHGAKMPEKIVLSYFNSDWHLQLDQRFIFDPAIVHSETTAEISGWIKNSVMLTKYRKSYDIGSGYSGYLEPLGDVEPGLIQLADVSQEGIGYTKLLDSSIRRESSCFPALINRGMQ